MKILVTNDDGDSEGLRRLLLVAKKFGSAYAIAPNRQRSAVSGAVTLHKPIRLHKIERDIYTINGTPSDCVLFAIHSGEVEKPDLVLSGINWGYNLGIGSILGSGTVAACWQACLEGISSIAFSQVKGDGNWHEKEVWGDRNTIVKAVEDVTKELLPKLRSNKFFNVNLPPKLPAKKLYTKTLETERYQTIVEKRNDPYGKSYYWIHGEERKTKKGTDSYEVIVNGRITISEISLDCFV